jgi:hypothetical protein
MKIKLMVNPERLVEFLYKKTNLLTARACDDGYDHDVEIEIDTDLYNIEITGSPGVGYNHYVFNITRKGEVL